MFYCFIYKKFQLESIKIQLRQFNYVSITMLQESIFQVTWMSTGPQCAYPFTPPVAEGVPTQCRTGSTICPRSLDPFNTVSYNINWGNTSWTDSSNKM